MCELQVTTHGKAPPIAGFFFNACFIMGIQKHPEMPRGYQSSSSLNGGTPKSSI